MRIDSILVPISLGELVDKISILELKCEFLFEQAQFRVNLELLVLVNVLEALNLDIDPSLVMKLKQANRALWVLEEQIRHFEQLQTFGEDFVQTARAIYLENDKRARLKRTINIRYGSALIEEKSYC